MKTKVADERLCYMIVNSCCAELADDDCFSNHCYHLITCQLEKMDSSLSISWVSTTVRVGKECTGTVNSPRLRIGLRFDQIVIFMALKLGIISIQFSIYLLYHIFYILITPLLAQQKTHADQS